MTAFNFDGAPFTRILVLDFETRWDSKSYTLSKLTTESYIRDKRFKSYGVGYKWYGDSDDKIYWVGEKEQQAFFDRIDWEQTAVLAHNAQFDCAILSWVFGKKPAFIFDSLSMARALRGIEVGNSLAKLAEELQLPAKGKAVHSTDGLLELTPPIEAELAAYCKHDVFLCEKVFDHLVVGYPAKELRLIDLTLKMFTNPCLELDESTLVEAIHEERERREGLLAKLDIAESDLASNDKFAAILRKLSVEPPLKKKKATPKNPNPTGFTYAFAKNDALFQALLNGDNEDVALLCEARLAVKSTLERTRAQRFLDISRRGTLPVPLNYYGAHTGRWSASKGSGINLQNLKRGSFLRKSISAPAGYSLIVADLSQIEPRVLAYLCDYRDLLQMFSSGIDVYSAFGAQMFNVPGMTKDTHPALRQSAKAALLGCFGADTKVLTQRGWVTIVSVLATDLLWDGEEWVRHEGLIPQGEKEVLTAFGVSASPDHEILTEHGWREWKEVLTNRSLFRSALSSASLPVSTGYDTTEATTQLCGALAAGKEKSTGTTYYAEQALDVEHALGEKGSKRDGHRKGTTMYARMMHTAKGCLIVSVLSCLDALTQKLKPTWITAPEALASTLHGLKTVLRFSSTSYLSPVGMSQNYSSTASTTTKGTSPEIFVSLPVGTTPETSVVFAQETLKPLSFASRYSKRRIETYDIAYAGPRNRYTILTDAGPMVVHNCGYGMGWYSFAGQLLTGFLGAPPVLYDKAFAKQAGVDAEIFQKFVSWEKNVERALEIPRTCTDEEIIIHSVATKQIVDKYRAAAVPVTEFWQMCNELIHVSLAGGKERKHKGLIFRKGEIVLPSGLSLKYPDLTAMPDEKGRVQWHYGKDKKKLYGGKIVENIVQAVARCVMTDGMLRIQKRYPVVLTVHDEAVALVPEAEAESAYDFMIDCMTASPKYMPGIPLAADGGWGKCYGDIK